MGPSFPGSGGVPQVACSLDPRACIGNAPHLPHHGGGDARCLPGDTRCVLMGPTNVNKREAVNCPPFGMGISRKTMRPHSFEVIVMSVCLGQEELLLSWFKADPFQVHTT